MKRYDVLRRLTAVLLAVTALMTLLCGCGKDKPEEQSGQTVTEQAMPDIFMEEAEQLGDQDTPPVLIVETTTGETVSATYATLGGYVWEWMDSDGRVRLSEEEAPCAADMKDIAVIRRDQTDGKAVLQITGGTLHSVQIWADSAPMEEGERLTVEGETIVFPAGGAYRYEVVVDYTGGRVYYAFMVTE